jgi:hypothetical protein
MVLMDGFEVNTADNTKARLNYGKFKNLGY